MYERGIHEEFSGDSRLVYACLTFSQPIHLFEKMIASKDTEAITNELKKAKGSIDVNFKYEVHTEAKQLRHQKEKEFLQTLCLDSVEISSLYGHLHACVEWSHVAYVCV